MPSKHRGLYIYVDDATCEPISRTKVKCTLHYRGKLRSKEKEGTLEITTEKRLVDIHGDGPWTCRVRPVVELAKHRKPYSDIPHQRSTAILDRIICVPRGGWKRGPR